MPNQGGGGLKKPGYYKGKHGSEDWKERTRYGQILATSADQPATYGQHWQWGANTFAKPALKQYYKHYGKDLSAARKAARGIKYTGTLAPMRSMFAGAEEQTRANLARSGMAGSGAENAALRGLASSQGQAAAEMGMNIASERLKAQALRQQALQRVAQQAYGGGMGAYQQLVAPVQAMMGLRAGEQGIAMQQGAANQAALGRGLGTLAGTMAGSFFGPMGAAVGGAAGEQLVGSLGW